MAISETDLKLVKSERMTDFSDGGGKMTGVEVVDGQVNNLFNDISQLDRTYGRVSLRKAYATVQTANTDTYLGSHVILTDPPDDPNVNVTLFSTKDWTDERSAARNVIESYSIPGPEAPWILYGDHVPGQKLLMLFSRSNASGANVPSTDVALQVGDVLDLSIEKAGYTANYQYVRMIKLVSRTTTLLTDSSGNFFKDILIIEISNPLIYAFPGVTPSRTLLSRNDAGSSPTMLRTTSVADAAQYFGVKPITQAMALNDLTVTVASPYSALVPSAQASTPLIDVAANMTRPNIVTAGAANTLTKSCTLSGSVAPDYAASFYMARGFVPGSLSFTVAGTGYKDDGKGNVVLANGTLGTYGGLVDYASGRVTLTKQVSYSSAIVASATPAVAVYDNAGTDEIAVTINNRSFNYVNTLKPNPSPGSMVVDFKALNKWYRLYDDGLGHLAGNVEGIGSGSINYATGSVLITLSALPDVGSSILFGWTTPLDYTVQTFVASQPRPLMSVVLVNTPVTPASLTITWTDGSAKTATSNANGTLSGDATGRIVYSNGHLTFKPNSIPTSGTVFTLNYSQKIERADIFSVTGDGSGNVTVTLTNTPVKPGSVRLDYVIDHIQPNFFGVAGTVAVPTAFELHDDGAGGFALWDGTAVTGTINYTTGVIVVDLTRTYVMNYITGYTNTYTDVISPVPGKYWHPIWTTGVFSEILAAGTPLNAHYTIDTDTPTSKVESVSLDTLKIDLSTATSEALVAGSLQFAFAGTMFIDRGGLIYRNHEVLTDAATASGSVDYQTGLVTLTAWIGGAGALTIISAVSLKGISTVMGVSGRAPGAPLATGQFQLNCTAYDGTVITGTADNNGDITGTHIKGHVDWLSGVFKISFGDLVADSTISSDTKANSGWYSAGNVIAGNIWRPMLVKSETIKFNAVLVSYIPLDASVLGVETVRLPLDGRVPIFRVGNVAVVHNTQNITVSNPAVAGSAHDCGRTLLSYAKVFDAAGLVVPTSKYTVNLDSGILTFANPLDLTGYTQPLRIEHRIEDMSLVTDVQITGQVQLMKPVRHAYPANTSFISSALVIGDLQARVTNIFDQQTWTAVFSATLIGSPAGASFNDVLYPFALTNAGAIQERWAIVFTGATAFNCYGEYSGLVAQGSTGVDFAPVNPITSVPYFTIDYRGWGAGWASGNVLRFDTDASNFPLWLARTTLQSSPSVYTDNFKLQIRGDAN